VKEGGGKVVGAVVGGVSEVEARDKGAKGT